MEYARLLGAPIYQGHFPKYSNSAEESLFRKVKAIGSQALGLSAVRGSSRHFVFYQEATQYWVKATVGLPYYAKNGVVGAPSHGRYLYVRDEATAHTACAIMNSSLFYAYFIAYGDCFHLSDGLASSFPVTPELLRAPALIELNKRLMRDLQANAVETSIRTRDGDTIAYAEFYASRSKPIIDEIDRVLAKHYGFTDEELDFIINYDIKYRMGREVKFAASE